MSTQYVTYAEAASILGRSSNAVRHLVSYGKLTPIKIKGQKVKMLDRAEVERYSRGEKKAPDMQEIARQVEKQAEANTARSGIAGMVDKARSSAEHFLLRIVQSNNAISAVTQERNNQVAQVYAGILSTLAGLAKEAPSNPAALQAIQRFSGEPEITRESIERLVQDSPALLHSIFPDAVKSSASDNAFKKLASKTLLGAYDEIEKDPELRAEIEKASLAFQQAS